MLALKPLFDFFSAIANDPRIGITHIALYMALYQCWIKEGGADPVAAFSYEIMPIAKIASSATYHRILRELNEYGYLRYEPSFNRKRRSRVYLSGRDNP